MVKLVVMIYAWALETSRTCVRLLFNILETCSALGPSTVPLLGPLYTSSYINYSKATLSIRTNRKSLTKYHLGRPVPNRTSEKFKMGNKSSTNRNLSIVKAIPIPIRSQRFSLLRIFCVCLYGFTGERSSVNCRAVRTPIAFGSLAWCELWRRVSVRS